jgi:hypothetical protein
VKHGPSRVAPFSGRSRKFYCGNEFGSDFSRQTCCVGATSCTPHGTSCCVRAAPRVALRRFHVIGAVGPQNRTTVIVFPGLLQGPKLEAGHAASDRGARDQCCVEPVRRSLRPLRPPRNRLKSRRRDVGFATSCAHAAATCWGLKRWRSGFRTSSRSWRGLAWLALVGEARGGGACSSKGLGTVIEAFRSGLTRCLPPNCRRCYRYRNPCPCVWCWLMIISCSGRP